MSDLIRIPSLLLIACVLLFWASGCGLPLVSSGGTTDEGPTLVISDRPDSPLGITNGANHDATSCYYYGDGGIVVGLSDEYLRFFQQKGFTRRSLCMAVISGIRFHPETGERLATMIFIDGPALEAGYPQDFVSDEVTLSPPDCFKRAQPYADCRFRYDPMTGKQLAPEVTARCEKSGKEIAERLGILVRDTRGGVVKTNEDEFHNLGLEPGVLYQRNAVGLGPDLYHYHYNPDNEVWSELAFYDLSPEFPDGFGYALYANGEAASGLSMPALSFALNSTENERQVNPALVKALWAGGAVSKPQPARQRHRLPTCVWSGLKDVEAPDRQLLDMPDGKVILSDLDAIEDKPDYSAMWMKKWYFRPVRVIQEQLDRSGKLWSEIDVWASGEWHHVGWTSNAMLRECVK